MKKPLTTLAGVLLFTHSTQAVSATYYFHNDHLGTPQVLTDASNTVVWRGDYSPFGQANETVKTVEQNLRFPGQYYDKETGLHYNYFRDYDPSIGRYIQSDPIGLRGGLSTYGYSHQNPIKFIDPDGRNPLCVGWPMGTAVCAVALVGAAVSVKHCSDGVDDLQEGWTYPR